MVEYQRAAIDLIDDITRNTNTYGSKNTDEKFGLILREYITNYNKIEIKKIVAGTNIDMVELLSDMPDLDTRFDKIRNILGIMVIDVSAYICTVFMANGYNYAYLYSIVVDEEPLPVFISVGANMISCDGEWRPLLMDICSYNILIQEYAKIVNSFVDSLPDVELNVRTFFSLEDAAIITDFYEASKFPKTLLALSMFAGQYTKQSGRQQEHTSSKFAELLGLMKKNIADFPDAQKIYDLIGSVHNVEDKNIKPVGVGQKLISLTPDELSHPLNASLKTWNEYNVSKLTTDLVLNCISPSFPVFGNWFFVFDTTKFLFNSDEAKQRIELSDKIMSSERMETDGDTILSNVAICMLMERVGLTLANQLSKLTKKYIFDIIYALHALNVKLGYIHGDLHGNNATIMNASGSLDDVCYQIEGKTYIFPHDGKYGCLIDFSRSMPIAQEVNYIDYIIKKYETHFPAYMDINYDKVLLLMNSAVDSLRLQIYVSKTTMAFDMFELTTSLLNAKENLNDEMRTFLINVREECEKILLSLLEHDKMDDIDYPSKKLIDKFYGEFAQALGPGKKISAFYNFDNELRYSIKSFDTLPKSMTSSPIVRDVDDRPIDVNTYGTNLIRVRYHLSKVDEANLIGL